MDNPNDPPLDEIQWRSPQTLATMGGLHSNTILFYFAESPFFERTSNNAVITSQAMNNIAMYHFIQTREAFEGRLKTMSGLEFIVGEEPAETGPGMGTGVWVIRKQTRRKRYQEEDEITVHASFFVVGENIYMAPTLADILASRIMTISSAIAKALPAAESVRKWRPATGHVYQLPANQTAASRGKGQESKEDTPLPGSAAKPAASTQKNDEIPMERAAEEAFMVHMRHGGEYIDENAITGRPGEFHLSSTGRKVVVPLPKKGPEGVGAMNGPAAINTKADTKKDGKSGRTPKSTTTPGKSKRRKSKMSAANTPVTT
ncbi:Mediator complex, subunit Med6 [Metarhizium rileyi]|uniref:Mediator of RNA polymerase II transcription subunit 6 n=1 Tax=Metarhizium rileyi (strain RCEF 4871) TaxID=1649241 RepID=A0A167GV88_METRR|nr:Mediator complex, subunit Med6 [Metarhizium rileyi RCEF 4871]TWU71508.1 Mediator of RNA polymerase II transcription subunit 6 [Metarhizium rileyi]